MRKLILTCILAFGVASSYAQLGITHFCDDEANERFKAAHPELADEIDAANKELEDYYASAKKRKRGASGNRIIPVVFHILHDNGPENISREQVEDAVRVLNDDFRKLNADTSDVASAFQSVIGKSAIEFRLAKKDPQGNTTTGINRVKTMETYVGDDGSKIVQWDRASYLNIWVVNTITSGAAGYTYRPGSVSSSFAKGADGIIVLHNYVGTIGTGSVARSRTITHEVGHWLNLLHTWGSGNEPNQSTNCNKDDGILDTPNTIGQSGGCNLTTNSCGSLDNVQNYMNYASCDKMFTEDQVFRMEETLDLGTAERNKLWTDENLAETGVDKLYGADFRVENNIVCFGDQVQFLDRSYYGQNSWEWSFTGANVNSSSSQNPVVTYIMPGLHDVELEVTDGSSTKTSKKENFIWALPEIGHHVPYSERFESAVLPSDEMIYYNDEGDPVKFEITSNGGFQGTKALRLNNFANQDGIEDAVVIGPIDVQSLSSIDLKFKYAYARRTTGDTETLRLLTSADCGNTWSTKWQKVGPTLPTVTNLVTNSFVPALNDWQAVTVTAFSGTEKNSETLLLKFEFIAGGGNNVYIDDIEIDGVFDTKPRLAYPRDAAVNQSEDITLDWKAVRGVDEYEYQIDSDPGFGSSELQSGKTTYLSANPNQEDTEMMISGLSHGTTYFWRVRSIDGGTASDWSQEWSFTVSANGVSVEEMIQKNLWQIFPNPASEEIHVVANSPQTNYLLRDLTGRIIKSGTINSSRGTIESTDLPVGVYLLQLSHNTGEFSTERIVISR